VRQLVREQRHEEEQRAGQAHDEVDGRRQARHVRGNAMYENDHRISAKRMNQE
jgi:hypothetical protein